MITATVTTPSYTGKVTVINVDAESRKATVRAIGHSPWCYWTHGGWCYTDTSVVSFDCLSEIAPARDEDPRTVAEKEADEQDADRYDQIADYRRETRFGVGL